MTNAALSFLLLMHGPVFFISLGVSLFYLVAMAVIAKMLINAFKLEGSEESAMVFLVVIFHPFALLLAIFFKRVFFK